MSKSIKNDPAEFTKYFLTKKTLYGPKKDPVWVYLEREMQENINKKPYNKKVGEWLKFLRDFKRYIYLEGKKERRILLNALGPLWFVQLSRMQQDVLHELPPAIHYDLIEDKPSRIRKCLSDLGVTRNVPKATLMKAMVESFEDAAVFIWKLYTAVYKWPPSELRGEYDMDAKILMSCLVFIDLEECLKHLEELTKPAQEPPKPLKKMKKDNNYSAPKCRYGMYLQKMRIPVYSRHPSPQRGQMVEHPPPRMEKKVTLRSENSYERLRIDHSFIEKRLHRCKKAQPAERTCNYKFWEAPVYLRAIDPAMEEYCKKLRVIQKKAIVCHQSAYENLQFNVGPIVLIGGRTRYLLNNIVSLPTGYIPIHGGTMLFRTGEYLTIISGSWKYPPIKDERCDASCACLEKWEPTVTKYLENSKCTCGHLYDFYHEGKPREKYFYPPTKHTPMIFDTAKIYQLDPMEDFIKEAVRVAERSEEPSPEPSHPELSAGGIKMKALLQSLLADLSDTDLVIPHLPQAHYLNNLLEWVRVRFKGKLPQAAHRQAILQSLRRWLWLKHMDFRKRAYMIPFTTKELESITWKHRLHLQLLSETLLADFTTRNRLSQLEQTRLWWSTMQFEKYPCSAFLDVYFTYMPGRMKDTYILNPFNAELTPRNRHKPCPL